MSIKFTNSYEDEIKNVRINIKYKYIMFTKLVFICLTIEALVGIILSIGLISNYSLKNVLFLSIVFPILILALLAYCNKLRIDRKKTTEMIINKYKDDKNVFFDYLFEEKQLIVKLNYSGKEKKVEYSFLQYYKIWLSKKEKAIVVCFNKNVREQKIVVIHCEDFTEFINYCDKNHLTYKIVR